MTTPPGFQTDRESAADSRARALLQTLADGQFHSGEELGEAAGVSRAAIWKLVEQLRELDMRVESVRGRGYRLQNAIELLDSKQIERELQHSLAEPIPVEVLFRCHSTNAVLLERARSGAGSQMLLTEIQFQGRGRWGRNWFSPFGSALCLSVLWQFPVLPFGMSGLSLAVAVEVAEALAQQGVPIKLKWPNDLMLENRKLGGILIELSGEAEGPCSVVIGIGINLGETARIGAQAGQAVASLEDAIAERAQLRNLIAAQVGAAIVRACQRFAEEGFTPFAAKWSEYDLFMNEPVVLLLPEEEVRGIARGVDASGALLLERNGQVESRFTGDLQLRLRRDSIT